jgi:hypothetical protein
MPADIIPIKVEWRCANRVDIDGLFQTVRGKGVGGGLKTEALKNLGRGLDGTRAERVLLARDEGGKTMDLRPPRLVSHPHVIKSNV